MRGSTACHGRSAARTHARTTENGPDIPGIPSQAFIGGVATFECPGDFEGVMGADRRRPLAGAARRALTRGEYRANAGCYDNLLLRLLDTLQWFEIWSVWSA